MIKLKEKWIWDFWLSYDSDIWYCYFLQADKSLKDPDLRHNNVTHGLATSKDLINWEYKGTVFAPSKNENFDDFQDALKSRFLKIDFNELKDLDVKNRNFIKKKESLENEKKEIEVINIFLPKNFSSSIYC